MLGAISARAQHGNSTDRDKQSASLHRFVRLIFIFGFCQNGYCLMIIESAIRNNPPIISANPPKVYKSELLESVTYPNIRKSLRLKNRTANAPAERNKVNFNASGFIMRVSVLPEARI